MLMRLILLLWNYFLGRKKSWTQIFFFKVYGERSQQDMHRRESEGWIEHSEIELLMLPL